MISGSGFSPLGESTHHSLTASPSRVRTVAERTTKPWAASSPAVSAKSPARSRSMMSIRWAPPSDTTET